MNHDINSSSDEELKSVHDVMNFFRCDKALAETILQSSKMNGQLSNIKKMCHDHDTRRENKNG